jgi:hypothetical protein
MSEPTTYRVLWTFTGENQDELDCQEGQIVHLIERIDNDWAKVYSQDTGEGLIPWSYIAPVTQQQQQQQPSSNFQTTTNDNNNDDDDLFSRFEALSTSNPASATSSKTNNNNNPVILENPFEQPIFSTPVLPSAPPPIQQQQQQPQIDLPSANDLQQRFQELKTRIELETTNTSSNNNTNSPAQFRLPDPPSLPPQLINKMNNNNNTPPPAPPVPPKITSPLQPQQTNNNNQPILPPPPPSSTVQAALAREAREKEAERIRLAQQEEARKEIERARLQKEAEETALRLRQQAFQQTSTSNTSGSSNLVNTGSNTMNTLGSGSGPNYVTLGQQYTKQAITHMNNGRLNEAARDYGRALLYFKQAFDQGVVPTASKLQILGWMDTLLDKLFEPPVWNKNNEFKDRPAVLKTMCSHGYVARTKAAELRLRALEFDKKQQYEEAVFYYSASIEYLIAHNKACKDLGKPTEADVLKAIEDMLNRAEMLKTIIKKQATQL